MSETVREFSLQLGDLSATEAVGEALGRQLAAGDLVILTGALGAGKTTLTQSLGLGLQVREGIISPTFVLARQHPSLVGGPGLIHVDAYRLKDHDDVDTLDLESTLPESVTVVEWGLGKVEHLTDSRLELTLDREALTGDAQASAAPWEEEDGVDEPRLFTVRAVGPRWDEKTFDRLNSALREATRAALAEPHTGELHD